MCRGVVAHGAHPAFLVNMHDGFFACFWIPFRHDPRMHDDTCRGFQNALDLDFPISIYRSDPACVAHLPARFNIKTGFRNDNLDLHPFPCFQYCFAIIDQRSQGGFNLKPLIGILLNACFVHRPLRDERLEYLAEESHLFPPMLPKAFPAPDKTLCPSIASRKPGSSTSKAISRENIPCDLQRQAVRRVELKRLFSIKRGFSGFLQILNQFIQLGNPCLNGSLEAFLFPGQIIQDTSAVFGQFRVCAIRKALSPLSRSQPGRVQSTPVCFRNGQRAG